MRNIQRHIYFMRSSFLAIITMLMFQTLMAQDNSDIEFNASLHTALNSKTSVFAEIETLFNPFKRDSSKMKQLVDKSRSVDYKSGESFAFISLGNIYRNISKYDKAIESHNIAEQLAFESGNQSLRIISLNMLGVDYRRMDLVRSALDYHSQALNLAYNIEEVTLDIKRSIAVSLNSIGNIYLSLKQYDLALIQFRKSLAIEKEEENPLGLAINYHNIGYAKEGKGLLDEALKDYKTSLKYNDILESEVGRSICFNSIGEVLIKKGMLQEAINFINEGLNKALIVQDQFYIASSYASLGWAQCEMGDLNRSQENLNKAIDIAQEYNLKSTEIKARIQLSEFYTKKGDFEFALTQFEAATELEKTITNERNLNNINDLVAQYEIESKSNTIKALTDENEIVKSRLEKFQLFLLLGVLGMLLSIVVISVYNRTKKLHQEKKILTLEQDMLRSQMNPHFIFNSLNSIKLYIINNEKENAVYYLNKFAKLIRKILMASSEKDIQLSDELETMSLYMNIENIRFSNEIDFQINVDDNVNPESIRVPSLILQPFLENALWHGLSLRKENRKVRLDVTKTNNKFVTITITDNGIGRQAAEEIKNKKTLKRKSVGIMFTRERLENFSKGFSSMYKIDIIDLYDEQNVSSGTKVVIDIPLRSVILESA